MELRPYQRQALREAVKAARTSAFVLVQAATGAGKTILFSSLIKWCITDYAMSVCVLAHREVLVRQARDKLLAVWPEGADQIGLACASVGKVDLAKPVIIGSPQTIANRIDQLPPIGLLIVDECHRVPHKERPSQYARIFNALEAKNPRIRVMGFTATPYRLGHGYIYGDRRKAGRTNWWPELDTQVSIDMLRDAGFLVPYRRKVAVPKDLKKELASVRLKRGEYDEVELGALMSDGRHVMSAVHAFRDFGEDRRHVVAFCVNIAHAEVLRAGFVAEGYKATVVHSKMSRDVRNDRLTAFERGDVQILCNVGVLTEGWDCARVDCVMLVRPTMSPALYVQMVGRGLRLCEGKRDCLILDFVDNYGRHGEISAPRVKVPGETGHEGPPDKTCPECHTEGIPASAKNCPYCGYVFSAMDTKKKDHPDVDMVEVPVSRSRGKKLPQGKKQVNKDSQTRYYVTGWSLEPYMSKRGHSMARLSLECRASGDALCATYVPVYMDVERRASSYSGSKAADLWYDLAGTIPPTTIAEALSRQRELRIPDTVLVARNRSGFLCVKKWGC